jgi:hypothetical protein
MVLVRGAFARHLRLAGWSDASRWGYDPVLECYWAELWPVEAHGSCDVARPDVAGPGGDVHIGPEHLIGTVTGLARAVAFAVEVADRDVYLALTA